MKYFLTIVGFMAIGAMVWMACGLDELAVWRRAGAVGAIYLYIVLCMVASRASKRVVARPHDECKECEQ